MHNLIRCPNILEKWHNRAAQIYLAVLSFRDIVATRCVLIEHHNSVTSAHDCRGVLADFFSPKTAEHGKSRKEWLWKLRGRQLDGFHYQHLRDQGLQQSGAGKSCRGCGFREQSGGEQDKGPCNWNSWGGGEKFDFTFAFMNISK